MRGEAASLKRVVPWTDTPGMDTTSDGSPSAGASAPSSAGMLRPVRNNASAATWGPTQQGSQDTRPEHVHARRTRCG